MSATDECIARVQALIEQQLKLLTLSLFICDKGSADFSDEELVCSLSEKMRTVVVPMSLAGGQSIGTILQSTQKRGIPVRDCFPIARSVVETLINAAYVLAGSEPLAEKAIRHTQQKFYRDLDKKVGRGEYELRITATPKPSVTDQAGLKAAIEEFTTARGREKSWTDDSVPMRIEKIGQALGAAPASGFLGAYALVYADSSEIIHGSLFGIQLFYRGRAKPPENVEEFRSLTAQHLEGILLAVFLALNSYLRAFCTHQKFKFLDDRLKGLFDEFMLAIRSTEAKGV